MALYNETDDWQRFAREQMQNSAQNLQQKQAGLDAAKNKKTQTTLESALSGLVNGLKERGSDIINTVKNIEKTKYGWLDEIIANNDLKNAQKDDSARRNNIAKKYGFNSYSEAINSDKAGDNFWNEIKASNEQTKSRLNKNADAYRNSITDVTKVNTNEAKGQALNTIDSVLGLIPGVGGVVANVAGGGISGVGDEYKAAGREGRDVDWSNAGKNALIGAASGVAGSLGGSAVGKVAGKMGGSTVGKLVGSNLAQGTIGGASAGAVGGALGTALNGGTLEDALLAAKEGAKAGAIGGGTMASVMGLGGTALDKIRNRGTTAQAIEPVDAEIVQKNRIEAPTAERIPSTVEAVEPVSNKRGIAITDLDAGEQPVNVRDARQAASRGKYIDGIVRGENLPEAKLLPTDAEDWYRNALDDDQRSAIMDMQYNTKQINELLSGRGDNIPQDRAAELARKAELVSNAIGQYRNESPITVYRGMGADEFANLIFGEPSTESFKSTTFDKGTAENFAKNQGGYVAEYKINPGRYGADVSAVPGSSESEFLLNKNIPYASVERDVPNKRAYITIGEPNPSRKITIESALGQTQDVPVENLATNYRKSTIPARQYNEQAIQNMPEAEIATRPTTAAMEAPEQRVATQERQVAANMSPADQARLERNITVLEQKQGNELLKQYGVLDKPTRRIVEDAPKVLANLQDSMGLTTPEEVQYAANHVTGGDGILAKATNQLASTATVDTRFEPNFIESLIEINGLNEADAKAVSKQIRGALNKLGERRKYVNGSDVLDTVKQLQGIARDYKGTSGTYHNATNADKFKVHVIEGVAQELEDRLWNAASPNIKQVITPELLDNMKQMYPGNTTWQNFVDGTVANARNGKELRAIQKPLVMGGYIVKGSKMSAGSFGETVANGAIQAGGAKGAAKNAAKVVADKVFNSPKQQQKRATKYQQQKQVAESQLRGETPVTTNTSKLGAIADKAGNIAQGAKNLGNKVAGIANNATASLNNDYLAGINGIRTRNGNPIEFNALGNQAAQFANKQMGKAEAERSQNRLENAQAVANAQADYDNALADYNAQEANYNANMAQVQNQATGASQLDRIAAAMEMALNAGDITAYGQLADLYKQAYNIYEMQNPQTKNESKALSANQAKALTAQQQLDALAQMTPNAGTVASGIPLLGNIVNLTGGNEYANQASSLATTLGYLLSGANIKESEAQRIGQAYVPTAFDSEAVRQQKLERARQLIQSYMSDTGALEA